MGSVAHDPTKRSFPDCVTASGDAVHGQTGQLAVIKYCYSCAATCLVSAWRNSMQTSRRPLLLMETPAHSSSPGLQSSNGALEGCQSCTRSKPNRGQYEEI